MKTIISIAEMRSVIDSALRQGKRIGFVPTMGFLHEGHLSLMRKARSENDIVVVSIFVNPTQFGPTEDLDRYPRDPRGDSSKCESAGVDLLFMPGAKEMYPEKPVVFVTVEGISEVLEGAIRPGHFRGVATVVAKLFHIVKPHNAYFGQKDYQQCCVIKQMVKGLNLDISVQILETVRETDGLAMSSRNSYLNADNRKTSAVLYRALNEGRKLFESGTKSPDAIKVSMNKIILEAPGAIVDYIEIADPETLAPLSILDRKFVILLAVRLGKTRLIDNVVI